MSFVSLTTDTLTRTRDLFTLYAKKNAFLLDEYSDVGAIYKRVVAALESSQKDGSADLDEVDAKYVLSAINVCSQRVPVEVQNYKVISELTEALSSALQPASLEEESKE